MTPILGDLSFGLTLVGNVIGGVASAIAFALIIYGWNILRNIQIRRAMTESVGVKSAGASRTHATVGIDNNTSDFIIVRNVGLVADRRTMILEYLPSDFDGKTDDKRGDSGLHRSQIERSYIELPPHSHGTWGLLLSIPPERRPKAYTSGYAEIEYRDLFHRSKLIKVSMLEWIVKDFPRMMETAPAIVQNATQTSQVFQPFKPGDPFIFPPAPSSDEKKGSPQ